MSTYRKEWDCCGAVTETDGYEPESCPFCDTTPQRTAQIAILRELLESGPKMESCVPGAIQEAAAQSANHMRNKWRDHIAARIKETEAMLAAPQPLQAEPHPPTRLCGCADCLPSFDDNASPPSQAEPQQAEPVGKALYDFAAGDYGTVLFSSAVARGAGLYLHHAPAQQAEPVAEVDHNMPSGLRWLHPHDPIPAHGAKLYLHPAPAPGPLTDDRILEIFWNNEVVVERTGAIIGLLPALRRVERAALAQQGKDAYAEGSPAQKSFWAGYEACALLDGGKQGNIRARWNQHLTAIAAKGGAA